MVLKFTDVEIRTFLRTIMDEFGKVSPTGSLKMFGIKSEKFKEHRAMAGFDNEPDARYRLLDEEVGAVSQPKTEEKSMAPLEMD